MNAGPPAQEAYFSLRSQKEFRARLRRISIAPALALGSVALALLWLVFHLLAGAERVQYLDARESKIISLENLVVDMETGIRGYQITEDHQFLRSQAESQRRLSGLLGELSATTRDPAEAALYQSLKSRLEAWETWADQAVNQSPPQLGPGSGEFHLQGKHLLDDVRGAIGQLVQQNQQVRIRETSAFQWLKRGVAGAILVGALFLAVAAVRGFRLVFLRLDAAYEASLRRASGQIEELRVLLRSIGDAVIATDEEGRVVFVNAVAVRLMGRNSEELEGKPLHEVFGIFNEETGRPAENLVSRVLKERKVLDLVNHTVLRSQDGTLRPIEHSAAPIIADNGALRGVILVFHDVTERRDREKRIQASEQRLRFLNELNEATRSMSDASAIMREVTRLLGKHLGASRCAYADVEDDEEHFDVWEDYTDGCESCAGRYTLKQFGEEAVGIVRSGRPFILTNLDEQLPPSQERDAFNAIAIKAVACYPLVKDGRLRALMAVHQNKAREWTEDELNLVEDVVERSWAHIERERIAAAMRQSEERLRLAAQATNDAIWDWDHATDQIHWNDAICRVIGCRMEEVEPTLDWWLDRIHPEDQKRVAEGKKAVIDGAGDHWEEEYRIRRQDGTYANVLDRGYVIRDPRGKGVRMIGAMQDLSERMRQHQDLEDSRRRLELAVEAAALGTWEHDPINGELIWDARCKELFGLGPQAKVDYPTFMAGLHPADRERTDRAIRQALHPCGGGHINIEYRTVGLSDGSGPRWVRTTGKALFNREGQAIRLLGTVQDITSAKSAEESLRKAKEQAEAASHAKDNFLAALSHELRTPLAPVLMTAAALREDERLPQDVRDQLASTQRNVELEARLIDDLLDLTRISRGKMQLRAQPCDVHSLLGLAVDIVRDEAQMKHQQLDLELSAHRTGLIADPARLQQVFWNVLRNAVKFTPECGRITIKTQDTADGLRVEISDTGIGLAPESLQRIFQPFEQAGLENDHRYGGLGLGLAIARNIVDLHGGVIRASSSGSDRGATFCVDLPGAKELPNGVANHQEHPEDPRSALKPDLGSGRPKLRLLVVEDHRPTLEVLTRLLTRSGHQVVTASCVADAKMAAAAGSFDGVVSDLGLPDGTGQGLMEHLRETYGLRGIALSGYGMEDDILRSKRAGFLTHLTKPIDFNQLRFALRQFEHVSAQG